MAWVAWRPYIGILAAVLFSTGRIAVVPAGSVEVALFLYVVSGNAGVVVVLDAAALGGEAVHDVDRQSRVTLAYVLVAVPTQRRRVAAKAADVRLQTLHRQRHHHHHGAFAE